MRDITNVFLILMRLDLSGERSIRLPSLEDDKGRFRRLDENGKHRLLVGVLDPNNRSTSTPMDVISFEEKEVDSYNSVLSELERLNHLYQHEEGFLKYPDSFNREAQEDIRDRICKIGCLIYDIFQNDAAKQMRSWLDNIFEGKRIPLDYHVTIITNDSDIPWYWLKNVYTPLSPLLCEAVSLGTLQLSSIATRALSEFKMPESEADDVFRALLINASHDLPSSDAILDTVQDVLETPLKGHPIQVKVERIGNLQELYELEQQYREPRIIKQFKIVHFCGHYSKEDLFIDGQPVPELHLLPFIRDSLLVLDGCSTSRGLTAWTDTRGITSELINRGGALGCITTNLPVKDDSIIADWFWSSFYRAIRTGSMSIGQALVQARGKLRSNLKMTKLPNPVFAFYQLCGSAAVNLEIKEDEGV